MPQDKERQQRYMQRDIPKGGNVEMGQVVLN